MAWPLTPLTTYIASSVPAIKAADLNSIQDAINQAFLGTYSYKAIKIDGTGGAAATPVSGTLGVSAVAAGTSTPTPAFTPGLLYKDLLPAAMVRWTTTGAALSIKRGVNISSGSRSGVGLVSFTLLTAVASWATAIFATGVGTDSHNETVSARMDSSTVLVAQVWNVAGVVDSAYEFCLTVFGV